MVKRELACVGVGGGIRWLGGWGSPTRCTPLSLAADRVPAMQLAVVKGESIHSSTLGATTITISLPGRAEQRTNQPSLLPA